MTIVNEIQIPKENSDDEIRIIELSFKNGDKVDIGDEIMIFDTSKTAISIEAEDQGYIEYLVNEGDMVEVGFLVIRIHDSKDSIDAESQENKPMQPDSDQIVSKAAQKYIKENNIDISDISKPFIGIDDVRKDDEVTDQESSKIVIILEVGLETKIIELPSSKSIEIGALSYVQSSGLISTVFVNVDLEHQVKSNNPLFANSNGLLPIIAFHTSKLLEEYPLLNGYFDSGKFKEYKDINLGIALDLGDGLKTYTIKNCNELSEKDVEVAISEGIVTYFKKQLSVDQITGSTFTISDLSALNIDRFVPLVNYKQSSILGISSVDEKLKRFNICLSFDHRVLEGKLASQFLNQLSERVQESIG